ncbi:MAG: hypothetical protein JSS62_00790 [Verrucomicrobia bacterium]|nr:hypothetical protein [Verrucomicrobiota bacterium]MBS0645951.1 hypothetical protein [Verrucomicrobiota bacterium]
MMLPYCVFTGYQQAWILEGKSFFPKVMPLGHPEANVVLLQVDCSSRSNLKWEFPDVKEWVMWDIQTDALTCHEPDEATLLSFELALDHFINTIAPHYRTFGMILYRGKPCVSPILLRSLAARLPDHIVPFIALDLSEYEQIDQFCHVLQREELSHLGLILKGNRWPYALPALGWDEPSVYGYCSRQPQQILPQQRVSAALCYGLKATFEMPHELCRLIPEELLTEEWEGIDTLYVAQLSAKGQRKVNGLLAAGAQVVQSVSK